MFRKEKKVIVQFKEFADGYSSTSTSFPLTDENLLDYLKKQWKHSGSFVITSISDDNVIGLTTLSSRAYLEQEKKISEIHHLIRQYINNQAIPQQAHAVFADGKLKGVFGEETHAKLKEKQLLSKGYRKESITIKPIEIESFQDFE